MMAPTALTNGFRDSITKASLRAYLAEFISTFFYVLAVVGSTMSSRKMTLDAATEPAALMVVGMANAFALAVAVYISWNASGGHVNPAVTFGMVIRGHVSVPTAMFYWFSQMMASVMACVLLKGTTAGKPVPTYAIAEEMTGFGASVIEAILTFALVYTVYVARDPRNGNLGAMGPVIIGFVAGSGVLAAGPFSGGSMNPACAFGSALVAGTFRNQAVYWVGPFFGATVAGLLYDAVVFPNYYVEDSVRGMSEGFRV